MSAFDQMIAQGRHCHCDVCEAILETWVQVDAVLVTLAGERQSASLAVVSDLKVSIENAFMKLHSVHIPNRRHSNHLVTKCVRPALQSSNDEREKSHSTSKRHRRADSAVELFDLSPSAQIVLKALPALRVTYSVEEPGRIQRWLEVFVKPRLKELGLNHKEPADAPAQGQPRRDRDELSPLGSSVERVIPRRHQQFIVCDHCRSHGLKCNEGPVCQECILREIACVHHFCRISPKSRIDCTRSMCYYVHEDRMPNSDGVHDPADPDWIILPGKLREYGCEGQIMRKAGAVSAEEQYARVLRTPSRQADAKRRIAECAEKNDLELDSVVMACTCVEDERQQETLVEIPHSSTPKSSPPRAVRDSGPPSPGSDMADYPSCNMDVDSAGTVVLQQGFTTPCTTPLVSDFKWSPSTGFGSPPGVRVGYLPGLGLDDCSPPR